MSEYTIKGRIEVQIDGEDLETIEVIAPDGKVVYRSNNGSIALIEAERIANAYNVPILRQRIAELEAESLVLNRKLVLANQYVGYLQAALEEIGSWSSVSLNRARVKKVIARALGEGDKS